MKLPADVMAPKRAAGVLGLHAATVRRWVREGRVKGYRLTGGRRRWVSVGECRALSAAGRDGGAAVSPDAGAREGKARP